MRKKKHLLIDPKSAKNIKQGSVSGYKVWNEGNSVSKFDEKVIDYDSRAIGAIGNKCAGAVSGQMIFDWEVSNEIFQGIDPKKYCYVDYPEMRF